MMHTCTPHITCVHRTLYQKHVHEMAELMDDTSPDDPSFCVHGEHPDECIICRDDII
jgi:hypothetical protein